MDTIQIDAWCLLSDDRTSGDLCTLRRHRTVHQPGIPSLFVANVHSCISVRTFEEDLV
jgi:hypothetical protein